MSDSPVHHAIKCQNPDCAIRYPCPVGHERAAICPLCQGPTVTVEIYSPPHQVTAATPTAATDRKGELVGVLDSIRSALNVGAMLRSADGVGLDCVYLCGLTAGADHPKVIKTALGAEKSVATSATPDVASLVAELRADGYEVWAIEATPRSEPLDGVLDRPDKLAFVVGNERAGVDPEVLRVATRHVHLPMGGAKTSLNVGVAFGVLAYQLAGLPVTPATRQI